MIITPYENGIHSLAQGLEQLQNYIEKPSDQFALKGAIIAIHHGFETLWKDILFQRNPVFILSEKGTIKQVVDCYKKFYDGHNNFLFDEEITITAIEALKRVKELNLGEIEEREYQALRSAYDSLNTIRNQLQHFAVKLNPTVVVKIFGDLTPKAVRHIEKCYHAISVNDAEYIIPHIPLPGMKHLFKHARTIKHDMNAFYPNAEKMIELLQGKYDTLLNEAKIKLRGKICEKLNQTITIVSHGKIGAPPYYPSAKLKGWLNLELDPHRNSADSSYSRFEYQNTLYTSKIEIGKFEFLEEPEGYTPKPFKQLISITAEASIEDHSEVIKLENYGQYIEFLRNTKLYTVIELQIYGHAVKDQHQINTIQKISGFCKTTLSCGVFGDPTNQERIELSQNIELTEENTKINLHFMDRGASDPNDRHSLNIYIDSAADINAQKTN